MAGPNQFDTVLHPGLTGRSILENGNLEPSPVARERIPAKPLVVRFGDELEAVDPSDEVDVQGLFLARAIVSVQFWFRLGRWRWRWRSM